MKIEREYGGQRYTGAHSLAHKRTKQLTFNFQEKKKNKIQVDHSEGKRKVSEVLYGRKYRTLANKQANHTVDACWGVEKKKRTLRQR